MTNSQPGSPPAAKPTRRWAMQPALGADLLEQVLATENVRRAWERVKAKGGAPGVAGLTIEEFPTRTRPEWASIRQALFAGTYHPTPVRRVEIPKKAGGKRPLGLPTGLDRVIQQALAQVLGPIFDPDFSESSFGYRPGRSAQGAVKQLQGFIAEGYRIAVAVDLQSYFDTVNHDIVMARWARKVRDKRVLRLIGSYLRAGVEVSGVVHPTSKGVPQGGNLSPLLSNLVLDDLDKELEKRGHRCARYCDDFVIVVRSQRAGERGLASLTGWLNRKLKLTVNARKSQVTTTHGIAFLGFTFQGTKPRWTEEAFQDFKHRLKRYTGRSWRISMEERIAKLNTYIRGWMNYFGIAEYYPPLPELDAWLRRRIRMCLWKQWRYTRTKVRELLRLGTHKRTAILTALSRKGPWHLARTLATQTGMTNDWIANTLGLVSLRDLWIARHYPS